MWTSDKPTAQGYYLWRADESSEPVLLRVIIARYGDLHARPIGRNVAVMGGQWAPAPEDHEQIP